jgi:hypothetical protein
VTFVSGALVVGWVHHRVDPVHQLRHAEHVAIEGETLLRVGDADG